MWAETILTGHTSAASSVSHTIHQLHQDWDLSQGGQLSNAKEHVAGDTLIVSREAKLNLLVPDPSIADSGN